MASGNFRFGSFTLDCEDRTLRCEGVRVDVSARYLDALILLVGAPGRLISKDRFIAEVWRGVPVTDEALTQCIKALRRQLGDDAARPRFIETVPKHGYRFIAPVESIDHVIVEGTPERQELAARSEYGWRRCLAMGGAGTLGAGVAGVAGGLFYGAGAAAQSAGAGTGGASALLVLLWLTIVAALVGGAGVSFGIAVAGFARGRAWSIVGGALGGLATGGIVKLLGLDAFNLLLGKSPGDITGGSEGLVLGASVGLGAWLAGHRALLPSLSRQIVVAALVGSAGGVLVLLLGGRLMGGSLDLLAHSFPGSRLRLGQLGMPFGNMGFGALAEFASGALEGALFGGCIVGAIRLAHHAVGECSAAADQRRCTSTA